MKRIIASIIGVVSFCSVSLVNAADGEEPAFVCSSIPDKPELACIQESGKKNGCLGNAFSSQKNCAASIETMKFNMACYESVAHPGYALIARLAPSITTSLNYFSSFKYCIASMRAARGRYLCMETNSTPRKWFVGDIFQEQILFGPDHSTQDECNESLQ